MLDLSSMPRPCYTMPRELCCLPSASTSMYPTTRLLDPSCSMREDMWKPPWFSIVTKLPTIVITWAPPWASWGMSLSSLTRMVMGELLGSDLDATQTQVALLPWKPPWIRSPLFEMSPGDYVFTKLLRYLISFASSLLQLMVSWILISSFSTRGLYMATDTRAAYHEASGLLRRSFVWLLINNLSACPCTACPTPAVVGPAQAPPCSCCSSPPQPLSL